MTIEAIGYGYTFVSDGYGYTFVSDGVVHVDHADKTTAVIGFHHEISRSVSGPVTGVCPDCGRCVVRGAGRFWGIFGQRVKW